MIQYRAEILHPMTRAKHRPHARPPFLARFGWTNQKSPNADCSRYFLGVLVGSPSLRLAESEKRTIFRMHLENALKDMRLDEEDKVT